MGRKKKIVEVDKKGKKLAGALEDCFMRWKGENEEPDTLVVYTTKQVKTKAKICAYYNYPNNETAVQYKVIDGSDEQKELFKLLGMTSNMERKIKRKKYTKRSDKNSA